MKLIRGMFIQCLCNPVSNCVIQCLFDCVIWTNQNTVFFLMFNSTLFLFVILVEHLCKNVRLLLILNSLSIQFQYFLLSIPSFLVSQSQWEHCRELPSQLSQVSYKSIYNWCTGPLYSHFLFSMPNTEYMVISWSVMFKSTFMIPNDFICISS